MHRDNQDGNGVGSYSPSDVTPKNDLGLSVGQGVFKIGAWTVEAPGGEHSTHLPH